MNGLMLIVCTVLLVSTHSFTRSPIIRTPSKGLNELKMVSPFSLAASGTILTLKPNWNLC